MSKIDRPSRRTLLKLAAGTFASWGLPTVANAKGRVGRGGTVRDRLWLFGVPANVNYPYLHHRSLMTPVEGAYYLSIPNVIMVQVKDKDQGVVYNGFEPPYDQYALALRPLKRVVWFIADGNGYTTAEDRRQVLDLARRTPNFVGVYMDDFFHRPPAVPLAALTLEQLRDTRIQLKSSGKKLDIFVTLYTNELDLPFGEYLNLIDVIVLWTWRPPDLVNLEKNLKEAQKLAPNSRILLGCYFYDFTARQPLSVGDMKLQCETGLRCLREGRIDGMVFLANTVEDSGFECVEWTRDWIQSVGDTII